MTSPVASPSMSIPDAGGSPAKAAAASPQTGDSFGAMLAQADNVTDSSAPDAGDPSPSQGAEPQPSVIAASDTAAAAVAMANQTPWMAQLEAAKPPVENEDTTSVPDADAHDADPAKQAIAQRDAAKALAEKQVAPEPNKIPTANGPDIGASSPPSETQEVESDRTPSKPSTAQQTPPANVALDETDKDTQVAAANAPDETAIAEDDAAEAASQAKPAAPPPIQPKDEKLARKDGDDAPSAPADTMGLSDLSSRVAAQFLAAPAAPQPPPASNPPANPQPKPEDFVGAALSAAPQAAPQPALPDKNGDPKAAAASDVRTAANAKTSGAREPRASADAVPNSADAPAAANANDAQTRSAGNNPPAAEHGAKNEPVSAAPNVAQATPAMPNTLDHAGLDSSTGAPAPVATASADMNVPVKLSFTPGTAPGTADTPSFDALALKIATRSANGENNFSLRLDPPELGRIEVNLTVRSDGHAHAELSADKPQTLELLQKDASSLERALKDAGLNMAGGLAFSLKGDGRSQAWRDSQGSGRGRNVQIAAVDAANANTAIAASTALAGRAYGLSTPRLDIRV